MVTRMDTKTCGAGLQNLRVGLVTETYAPEVNGVAMTLERLVNGLCEHGYRVDIFRPARSRHDRTIEQDQVHHIPVPGMPIPGYREMHFGFPAGRLLLARWRQRRPDVLYVATEGPLGASAVNAALKLKIPVISGFHTNFHRYSSHYRPGWLAPVIMAYLRRLHNKTAMTLVPTQSLARELSDRGFKNVEVMQRGVDISLFCPMRRDPGLRRQWGADDDSIVCIYVGRIAPEKNIQTAVDTVLALSTRFKIQFVLVGDGPLRKRLQRQNPGFIFCGTRLGEDLAVHYASADILLFPSRTETFGNVVTEAMASGLTTIAYDDAAAHEHITDFHNGLLAHDTPARNFTAVAMHLCSQPGKIRTIGQNAAEYAGQLGWPSIVARFRSLLLSACGGTESIKPGTEFNPEIQR